MTTSAEMFESATTVSLLVVLAITRRESRPLTAPPRAIGRKCSVLQRPVEVDGRVRTVAKRLVAGVAAPAERHLIRVRNLSPVDIGQVDRAGDEVRTVLARSDGDLGHVHAPSTARPQRLPRAVRRQELGAS